MENRDLHRANLKRSAKGSPVSWTAQEKHFGTGIEGVLTRCF